MFPTIDSFKWASDSWKMIKASTGSRTWEDSAGDLAMQLFQRAVPTGLPVNWRNVSALRAYLLPRQPRIVSTLSINLIQFPCGITGALYITKEWSAPSSDAVTYMGTVTLPFRQCFCNFYFSARELGMPGARELALLKAKKIQLAKPLDTNHAKPPAVTPADAEKFDGMFPDHPVSRVRGYIRFLRETLTIDAAVKAQAPFGA
jgi:hypothetical protein